MPARAIRGLGEIALRVRDLDVMQDFYQKAVGLELVRRFENVVFFRIAEGFGGDVQVLALFDRSNEPGYSGLNAATTTVDHIALRSGWRISRPRNIAWNSWESRSRRPNMPGCIGGRCTLPIPTATRSKWFVTIRP